MTHRVLKSHKSKMGVIYICNHENNVPSRLSRQWLYGNSCIWAHDVWLHIAGTNEPKSAEQAKQQSKHSAQQAKTLGQGSNSQKKVASQ